MPHSFPTRRSSDLGAVRRCREAGRLHQLDEARQAPEGDGLGRREALLNLVHRQIGRQLEAVMEERALAGMRQPGIEKHPAPWLQLSFAGVDALAEAEIGRAWWWARVCQYV